MKKILLLMAVALPFVLISCSDDKDEPVYPDNHEWVDLGMPSGTLWATCNIGANKPEEYGDYFAWGETVPKDVYDMDNYKWPYYSKYNDTDMKTELELEDDAAYMNWGAQWRMPSLEQFDELCNSCSCRWTQRNGVNGQLLTGPNGNTLFLPAANIRCETALSETGSRGCYWSRMRYTMLPGDFLDGSNYPVHLEFSSDDWRTCSRLPYRYFGLSVRAVCVSKN